MVDGRIQNDSEQVHPVNEVVGNKDRERYNARQRRHIGGRVEGENGEKERRRERKKREEEES